VITRKTLWWKQFLITDEIDARLGPDDLVDQLFGYWG